MISQDPNEQFLVPLILSMRSEAAQQLIDMAIEMEISLDELVSALAEDSVIGLESTRLNDHVVIPDRVSTDDLIKILQKS